MNAFIERHPIWTGVALAAVSGAVFAAFALFGDGELSIFSLLRLLWIAALPTFLVRFRARSTRGRPGAMEGRRRQMSRHQ